MLLVIVQRHGDAADNAVAANDGRHGDGKIGQAVLAHHERGNGQNGLLVTHDGSADTLDGHGDAIVGGVLLLDDGVGGVLDVLGDALLGSLMLQMTVKLAEGVQRNAGNLSAGPSDKLGVAVLTHDIGLDIARVDLNVGTKHLLQTAGVEHGTGADDMALGQAGHLDGGIGQNIDRVGDDEQNAVEARLLNLGDNGLKDVDVLVDQVQAGLTGLLGSASGDDDHGGVGDIGIIAGVDLHRLGKRHAVRDIQSLTLGAVLVHVDEDHLGEQTALHQRERRRRTDETAADNSDLLLVNH